jgi:hypothetical protein
MEFNWIISAMDCKIHEGEMTDVVQTVHWRYNTTDIVPATSGSTEKTYFAEMYGATQVGEPTPENFTSYPDLTKEQVVGWLEAVLDIDTMDENLTNQIELQINPIDVTLPPPFSNNPITGSAPL